MKRREHPWLPWLLVTAFILCGIGVFSSPRPTSEQVAGADKAERQNYRTVDERDAAPTVADIIAARGSPPPAALSIAEVAAQPPAKPFVKPSGAIEEKSFTFKYGDTFAGVLKKAGLGREQAVAAIIALEKVFEPSQIKAGRSVDMTISDRRLQSLRFKPRPGQLVGLKRGENGDLKAWKKRARGVTRTLRAAAAITTSLAQVSQTLGVPRAVLAEAVTAFSYEIDFQRDIQPDSRFDFLFEVTRDEDNGEVIDARLLRASVDYRDKNMLIYRFEGRNGDRHSSFYHKDGSSVVKSLLRTPVNAMRISSRFGKRRDPILGYTRVHRGVDFAAPGGTPVYAAGEGVVERAGWYGNYGRYVRIRHNRTYSTAYAHLKSLAKGLESGRRVHQGQVIGYVGSSGRSTGPHLHFEVHKNKVKVNPLALSLPSGKKLGGDDLEQFHTRLVGIDALHLAAEQSDSFDVVVARDINAQGGE